MTHFKNLFSSVEIGKIVIKNRIMITAHQTNHVKDGIPTSDMAAYHAARAKGGAGLIVLEAAAVHPSGMLTTQTIAGYDHRVIPAYSLVAKEVHRYGTKVFSQLFHGGREVVSSDYRNAAWAPSAEPSLRFSVMPKPMSLDEINQVIDGFALSAKLAKESGLDGVEICCSHGYLPAQFWSGLTNHRKDHYGGSFENRMRFIVEVMERVWKSVGEDFTVGIRMSADEKTMDGLGVKDSVEIVKYLVDRVRLDFINVTSGDSSTYAGSTHIAPASPMAHGYNAPYAFKIRMAGAVPVFVGSRVLDPAEAERIVSTGQADIVGMTRATIVDPEMPNKAINGELQTITACLGCNQACIGHYHKGLAIGCVQNPMAGNEEKLRPLVQRSRTGKRVVVIGAGPAGLQAAVTASDLGHQVTLIDQTNAIGGLLRIMRRAPMRREVAETMLDNYTRKLSQSNVNVQLGQRATRHEIGKLEADVVICAAGARPYLPHVEGIDHPRLMLVDELFGANPRTVGRRVLVFDYFGDWPGVEAAIFLAEKGHDVTLVSARLYIGEEVHQYLRNEYLKKLYTLKVTLLPHFDFGGITQERVILRNLFTHEAEQIGDWDTIVLSMGRVPNTELYEEVKGSAPVVRQIGDCLAPRTLEEATFEGMMAALEI
ncbi:FAD-dependent oxidoreductase [Brevibacillus massiliensis]|uniref:oxidoreductase n=1 Tax=Brevibacillus massiliensis TaxID=1118054 RepID=UPI0002D5742A|nr:FAD-dependent oxidoreductase [Brevibacillus massiliensis]